MHGNLIKVKKILILGASSDIGFEVVKNFLNNGWSVIAHVNRGNNKITKLIKINKKKIKIIKANFTKKKEVQNLIKTVSKIEINSFVNLVGYIDNKSFLKTDLNSQIKSISINTLIPNLIKRSLISNMIKLKFGRILDVSSIGVKYGGSEFTYNYALSKHALEFIPSFFKNLTKENILTNILRVGVVDTKLLRKIKGKNITQRKKLIPIKRMATAKEISNSIYDLSSDKNTYISGEIITISGGE